MIVNRHGRDAAIPPSGSSNSQISPRGRLSVSQPESSKIRQSHQDRSAVVYVRQSTMQQVLEHRESTALQYNLRCKAIEWGWPQDRVVVIDEDLGRSGSSAEGRTGFQRLLAEVGLDHVGLVLGIEMSRLARSCRDWYQLLELCGVFGVLIADQEGLYDPQQYNDRLLLGLKGTISEAELHLLRQRTLQGMWNKAARGELSNHAPMGYVREPAGELQMDPDQQVQSRVRLLFTKFEQIGSINGLLEYLVERDLRLPIRSQLREKRGELQWQRPNRTMLASLLHHPVYAGAYTWGRRPVDPKRKKPGSTGSGRITLAAQDCPVFIKDRCPAYITWEQYQGNLRQMQENQSRWDRRGTARGGGALLAGLVICSKCGCRLLVSYPDKRHPRYTCMRRRITYGEATCQSFAGHSLEALVEQQLMLVLEPAALELSMAAIDDIQRERALLDQQWRQRLERAGIQSNRAARQFHAVEPENRLVVRELEKRWEQSLREEEELKDEYARFQSEQPVALGQVERDQIRSLASDVPDLWRGPGCSAVDRQEIVRHLIERVVVDDQPRSGLTEVAVHFVGGFVSRHELDRKTSRWDQHPRWPQLVQRIRKLADGKRTAGQIAEALNSEGWRPPKVRSTFNVPMVQNLLSRLGLCNKRPSCKREELLEDHEWWLTDLAHELDVSLATLHNWLRRGWVHARQLAGSQGKWILWADEEELTRLKALRSCERGWYNKPLSAELTKPKLRSGPL